MNVISYPVATSTSSHVAFSSLNTTPLISIYLPNKLSNFSVNSPDVSNPSKIATWASVKLSSFAFAASIATLSSNVASPHKGSASISSTNAATIAPSSAATT